MLGSFFLGRQGMVGMNRLGMMATCFSVASLFAYHPSFTAPYSMPKLAILAIGLAVMSTAVIGGVQVDSGRPLMANGFIMLGVCLVSALFAKDKWLAFAGNHNSYALGLLGITISFCYHIAAAGGKPNGIIPLAGAIMGIHGFAQWAGFDASISSQITGNRAIGTIGSPVFLGTILGVIMPLAIEKSWTYALAVSLGLMATGSRGAWIAAVIGILAYGYKTGNKRTLIHASIIGLLAFYFYGNRPYMRSDLERIATWKTAVHAANERPLVGVGPDGFGNSYRLYRSELNGNDIAEDAHNDILQAAATIGYPGLLTYLALVFVAFTSVTAPAFGAVTVAFINAKANPLPLEVIVLLAVIVGLYSNRDSVHAEVPTWVLSILAVITIVIIGTVSRMALADHVAKTGDIGSLARACELNPFELSYKTSLVNRGLKEMVSPNSIEWKEKVMAVLRKESDMAIRLRPSASTSWHIAAFVSRIDNKIGLKSNPAAYLNKALEIDPSSEQLIALKKRL